MNCIECLKNELEKFYSEYDKLNPSGWSHPMPHTTNAVSEAKLRLIQSGQLVIDFYKNVFLSKYSDCDGELVASIGSSLEAYAAMAQKFVDAENTFGLGVLFIPRGNKISDPSELELMIKKLSDKFTKSK